MRTLKNKICKDMTSVSKNIYIDKLNDIVDKYNNTYHSRIKVKPVDIKINTYIGSSKEINNKNPKFKIGDIVRISTYKNIFSKGHIPNCSEEVFVIKKVKILCRGDMLLMILMEKKLLEIVEKVFTKTNCKKQIKKNLELRM